ncbi:hypothetical protein SAMN06265222_118103 [Neorhodopirellula lusitana]|uniref:Uncharacterized protein n=1 Tax=Neorhodopirellula lusitana TaxID=445327 RepID=A0ABY1QLS2_9BACT|nr:hypothetical protein SAMN06265222_118103 [Neorhodopirellula lusitana]
MGRRPRVSASSLPMALRAMLPSGMHKPWAGSNSYQISGLNPLGVAGPPTIASSSLPFCVRFQRRLQLMMSIRRLQHSIPGVWRTLTRTGITPASQSDLASPHVHFFVLQR